MNDINSAYLTYIKFLQYDVFLMEINLNVIGTGREPNGLKGLVWRSK